jgi:C-methyltransferase
MNPAYLACSGWIASAVGTVAALGVADQLADGPRTAADLAIESGSSEYVLTRIMHLLSVAGLFTETADGFFANTADSELLKNDHPRSVRHMCMLASGDYQRIFQEILHTVSTGEPATRKVVGGSLYGFLDRAPASGQIYDLAMEDLSRPVGAALARGRDFSSVDTVVDVGGGSGAVLKGLLKVQPHLKGICVDRPDVCERASRALLTNDPSLVGRLEYVGGDFFTHLPSGAALYLLKNVLHSWNDDSSVKILRSIGGAMSAWPEARLIVIEPLLESKMPSMYKALDDLMQVVVSEPGVTARSESDFERLIQQAGLVLVGLDTLSSGHAALEIACAPSVESQQTPRATMSVASESSHSR